MSSSDDDAASSSPSGGTSSAATVREEASLSGIVSEPEPDGSASKSAAASADEPAEQCSESHAGSRGPDASREPSAAATVTSGRTSESDASSSSPESDVSPCPTAGGIGQRGQSCGLSGFSQRRPELVATEKIPSSAAETEADGSPTAECSGESSDEGSVSEPGKAATAKAEAATAKADSGKVIETFEVVFRRLWPNTLPITITRCTSGSVVPAAFGSTGRSGAPLALRRIL